MKRLSSKRKKLISILVILIILVLLMLYIGFPTAMAIVAVAPEDGVFSEPPLGFSDISLRREDGVRLGAWYAETQNGAGIILVHGAGGGRNSVRDYAIMLQDEGFGVLALSIHGYDNSEGNINRLGWDATPDIGAAMDFLTSHDDVKSIGGLGISMGGEILLGAAAEYPAIKAIVADGATLRGVNDYVSLESNRPLYRSFTQYVFSFMVGVFSGDEEPEPTLLQSIQAADGTSFLFIAAGTNETEIAYNSLFHESISERSRLWVVADVAHTAAYRADAQMYTQQLIDFYSIALLIP